MCFNIEYWFLLHSSSSSFGSIFHQSHLNFVLHHQIVVCLEPDQVYFSHVISDVLYTQVVYNCAVSQHSQRLSICSNFLFQNLIVVSDFF